MSEVKINQFSEIIARKLSGIGGVPVIEQQRMIGNAIVAATKYHDQRIATLQRQNALLRAVAEAFHEYDECSGGRCSEELEDCRQKYQAAIDGGAVEEPMT